MKLIIPSVFAAALVTSASADCIDVGNSAASMVMFAAGCSPPNTRNTSSGSCDDHPSVIEACKIYIDREFSSWCNNVPANKRQLKDQCGPYVPRELQDDPSDAPVEQPTDADPSDAPVEQPTDAEPSDAPVEQPDVESTSAPTDAVCADAPATTKFDFVNNGREVEQRSCRFIRNTLRDADKPKQRRRALCAEEATLQDQTKQKIGILCPRACQICPNQCKDKRGRFRIEGNSKIRNCGYLEKRRKGLRRELCDSRVRQVKSGRRTLLSNICEVSCGKVGIGRCAPLLDESDPSPAPTFAPTPDTQPPVTNAPIGTNTPASVVVGCYAAGVCLTRPQSYGCCDCDMTEESDCLEAHADKDDPSLFWQPDGGCAPICFYPSESP